MEKPIDQDLAEMRDGTSEQSNADGFLVEHSHFCAGCGVWQHQGTKEDCCYGGAIYVACPDCEEEFVEVW